MYFNSSHKCTIYIVYLTFYDSHMVDCSVMNSGHVPMRNNTTKWSIWSLLNLKIMDKFFKSEIFLIFEENTKYFKRFWFRTNQVSCLIQNSLVLLKFCSEIWLRFLKRKMERNSRVKEKMIQNTLTSQNFIAWSLQSHQPARYLTHFPRINSDLLTSASFHLTFLSYIPEFYCLISSQDTMAWELDVLGREKVGQHEFGFENTYQLFMFKQKFYFIKSLPVLTHLNFLQNLDFYLESLLHTMMNQLFKHCLRFFPQVFLDWSIVSLQEFFAEIKVNNNNSECNECTS